MGVDHFQHIVTDALRRAAFDACDLPKRKDRLAVNSLSRFLAAVILLVAAALFLRARSGSEVFPARSLLSSFPDHIGSWTGTDVAIDQDVRRVLGPGDFLSRLFSDPARPRNVIDLFLAYFPSQRTGDTIHSPKNCLPGAGWSAVESRRITLSVPAFTPFPVNRYVIVKGDTKQLVLYWYWSHDRGVASEYWAKYYLVADSIRMNRSDGALVRMITTFLPGETSDAAEQRLLPFAQKLVPLLNEYIPR